MRAHICLVVAVLALCACGGSPTNPTQDWITIRTSTPASGAVLKAGEPVTFAVTLDATLVSSDTGTVRLLITTEGLVVLNNGTPGPPAGNISKGVTTVTLTDTVTIPHELSGSTVQAVVPIWIDGVQRTGQWATIVYKVQ